MAGEKGGLGLDETALGAADDDDPRVGSSRSGMKQASNETILADGVRTR